jgi:hypothetical protein
MIYKETFESNLKFLESLSQEERQELFRRIQQKCKEDKRVSPFSICESDEYDFDTTNNAINL